MPTEVFYCSHCKSHTTVTVGHRMTYGQINLRCTCKGWLPKMKPDTVVEE